MSYKMAILRSLTHKRIAKRWNFSFYKSYWIWPETQLNSKQYTNGLEVRKKMLNLSILIYLHRKSCVNGKPCVKDIGGTFISLLFDEFFSGFVLWAAAAAAANRAAILWAASTFPFPVPPPAWAAATSASKSGRGFRSCENSGDCCKKRKKNAWITRIIAQHLNSQFHTSYLS